MTRDWNTNRFLDIFRDHSKRPRIYYAKKLKIDASQANLSKNPCILYTRLNDFAKSTSIFIVLNIYGPVNSYSN